MVAPGLSAPIAPAFHVGHGCLERTKSPPFGLAGGGAGVPGPVAVVAGDGAERELHSKGALTAPAHRLIALRAPGSSGFGRPMDREPARLRDDVINGYVSEDAGRSAYQGSAELSLGCPVCSARTTP